MLLPKSVVKDSAKVLIVEDQPSTRLMVRSMLEHAGFKNIQEAENGEEGLEKVREEKPDLVFLDVVMPKMDGFHMCQEMKNDPKMADIPILFLTALDDVKSRTSGYKMGAVDYVNKPIQNDEILARAEVHIHNGMLKNQLQLYFDRVSAELDLARTFQKRLLPQELECSSFESQYKIKIQSHFQASEELAGDYWQIFKIDKNRFAVALVDFTGHGVAAALNTATAHGLFQDLEADMSDPLNVGQALNKQMRKILSVDSFATFFYGVCDVKKQTLSYIGCGSTPIAHLPADKGEDFSFVDCSGFPLGIVDEDRFDPAVKTLELKKGDTLFLYSDALTEAKHKSGKRWLEDGLTAILDKAHHFSEDDFLGSIKERFNQTAQMPLKDDLTMVSITF